MVKIKKILNTNKSIETTIYYDSQAEVTGVNFIGKDSSSLDGSLHPFLLYENGEISEIEVLMKPSKWKINNKLTLPKNTKKGRVLCEFEDNGPIDMGKEEYYTNNNKEFLYIQLYKEEAKESVEIAKNIILDITPKNKLGGVWINLHECISYYNLLQYKNAPRKFN